MSIHKWEALGLFPTPLVKTQIKDYKKARAIFFSDIIHRTKVTENHEKGLSENPLAHFNRTTSVFDAFSQLDFLEVSIAETADFVYRQLLNHTQSGALEVTNAWFNLADVGASQAKHAHANCLLCGTLYLNTDSETAITFYHPLTLGSMHPELHDEAVQSNNQYGLRFHFQKVTIRVAAGDCLFWPPHLLHGYENNRTPNRLSLSFNLMPKRLHAVYQVVKSPNQRKSS